MARRGRPKQKNRQRYPNGRVIEIKPTAESAIPIGALRRRAEALGIPASLLRDEELRGMAGILSSDKRCGHPLGILHAREIITNRQRNAGSRYEAIRAKWRTMEGLRRAWAAPGREIEPSSSGEEMETPTPVKSWDEMTDAERAEFLDELGSLTQTMKDIGNALNQTVPRELVKATLENIVIEGALPEMFLSRPRAVEALKTGLDTIADALNIPDESAKKCA